MGGMGHAVSRDGGCAGLPGWGARARDHGMTMGWTAQMLGCAVDLQCYREPGKSKCALMEWAAAPGRAEPITV